MTSRNKNILIILLFGSLFLTLFFLFGNNENYKEKRDLLQSAVDQYIEETDCYPAVRKVSFGNPSPIDFQKIYSLLPSEFEFNDDLYYWISLDGKVWVSKTNPPEIQKGEDNLIYDRQGRLHYYLYYYEDDQLKKEETREKEIPLDYAISESYGDGLATPPITDKYEGYEKHKPIITVKNEEDSLDLLSLIEKETSPNNGLLATIGNAFKKEGQWIEEYGFDLYGEDIVEGEHKERDSLGEVKIKTEDGRESLWVDLSDPTSSGTCFLTNKEEVNKEIVEVEKPGFFNFLNPKSTNDEEEEGEENEIESAPDQIELDEENTYTPDIPIKLGEENTYKDDDSTTTYKNYNTREVTVEGGPKKDNNFEEVISFTTTDGFSGLLYKHGEPSIKKEETVIFDYLLSEEDDFPNTIEYSEDNDQELELQFVEKTNQDEYIALYKGNLQVDVYYQLYRGILRK